MCIRPRTNYAVIPCSHHIYIGGTFHAVITDTVQLVLWQKAHDLLPLRHNCFTLHPEVNLILGSIRCMLIVLQSKKGSLMGPVDNVRTFEKNVMTCFYLQLHTRWKCFINDDYKKLSTKCYLFRDSNHTSVKAKYNYNYQLKFRRKNITAFLNAVLIIDVFSVNFNEKM